MRKGSSAKHKGLYQTRPTLIQIIRNLGLTQNLLFCLDAGDFNSYSGGTRWLDTSGNGNHFIRGTAETTAENMPQFEGTLGRLSEREHFRGVTGEESRFTPLDAITFDDAWQRNNGTMSFIAIFGLSNLAANYTLLNNSDAVGTGLDDGVSLHISDDDLEFRYDTSDLANAGTDSAQITGGMTKGRINFCGVSWSEPGPTVILQVGGIQSTSTTSASVNTQSPPGVLTLGSISTTGNNPLTFSTKYFLAACWSSALSGANLTALYDILKQQRFPSMA